MLIPLAVRLAYGLDADESDVAYATRVPETVEAR